MGYVAQNRKHLDSLESYTKMFENKMEMLETEVMVIASITQGLIMIDILQNDLNVIQVEYSNFEKHLDNYEQQRAALQLGHLTEKTLPIDRLQEILEKAKDLGLSYASPE